ncbi:MAG: phosphoribosylformylglycinamidine synthase [Firmicutes bacterium]|nr:phosphoribosylformylglycinamidine synthase [Bacillota bacterium]
MNNIKRIFVEKKENFNQKSKKLKSELNSLLNLTLSDVRVFLRYDVQGIDEETYSKALTSIFSEPPVDTVIESNELEIPSYSIFGIEYLPGQYDQRADSAEQCVQLLSMKERPIVRCATIYAVQGANEEELERIKKHLINPVEMRLAQHSMPDTLELKVPQPQPVYMIENFIDFSTEQLKQYHIDSGSALTLNDLKFIQAHYRAQRRNPTDTEMKIIDTYWSDHCRHTTFLTHLEKVVIKSKIPQIQETYNEYIRLFNKHHEGKIDKFPCLMDIATMGARELKREGILNNVEESDEINACSIKVKALVDDEEEDFLVMFKNETHNHPTEIEPFGGAATCLGGAIRDPLSGRAYVYQAMRISGAADINSSFEKTIKGKLPQRVISQKAAEGFSSYGNQIGLATGIVDEVYHSGYLAKRLECGFVVAAAKAENVKRLKPETGDVIMLIGGETGRDGCGGATGSSKSHTADSLSTCGAEVQKGNPIVERKIQRLFRNPSVQKLIKKCNDFGAGGVCVAIGELADGLDIFLDNVPKKYSGLSATEIATSESQERMAVVISKNDADTLKKLADEENLDATHVATVTDTNTLRMFHSGKMIVDIPRKFLDSNGARQVTQARIEDVPPIYFSTMRDEISSYFKKKNYSNALKTLLSSPNTASRKGMIEMFDSTIGAGSVLVPFGGKTQNTPAIAMAALLPLAKGKTNTATVASWGFDPYLMEQSPYIGAMYSVILSVIKVVLTGAPLSSIRLTFQEYFERLGNDEKKWGKPLSALLGALYAQLQLELGAIGGKDSMSGTFEKLNVPPTLISFALGIANAEEIISNVLKKSGQRVYRYALKKDKFGVVDFENLKDFLNLLHGEIKRGHVKFATMVESGGAVSAIAKSCFGEELGFKFAGTKPDLFSPQLGDILIAIDDEEDFIGYDLEFIGETTEEKEFIFGNEKLSLEDALKAFNGTFENIFPQTVPNTGEVKPLEFNTKKIITPKKKFKTKSPKVFIPCFPGTNCEYDTARPFLEAGAEVDIFVVKNRSKKDIEESVAEITKRIKNSQIIAFPGGFSGGDEPDGSGKFIATTFLNPRISEEVHNLLYKRDGLAIGICNGFQALVKMGLLPYGHIKPMDDDSPTLTYNNISRHVTTVSYIKVASNLSPWLRNVKVGDVFAVPKSNGEGKFVCNDDHFKKLIENGQIATQYCYPCGVVTNTAPFNPTGALYSIEGITSPDGRILGKMGHSERVGKNLMKNIDANFDMEVFKAGVEYFK